MLDDQLREFLEIDCELSFDSAQQLERALEFVAERKEMFGVIMLIAAVVLGVFAVLGFQVRAAGEKKLLGLHQQLKDAPLSAIDVLVREIKGTLSWKAEHLTAPIYRTALDRLSENPESPIAKQLVLDLGRWHFGRCRPGGQPSVYDEQAIQNDILVRSHT